MRSAKMVLIAWLLCALALWVRGGESFCVLDGLPFVERPVPFSRDYDWLALAALLIGLWGYFIMPRTRTNNSPQSTGNLRAGLLLVPLTILGLAMLSRGVRSSLRFEQFVNNPDQLLELRHLAVLCIVVFAALLVIKALRQR